MPGCTFKKAPSESLLKPFYFQADSRLSRVLHLGRTSEAAQVRDQDKCLDCIEVEEASGGLISCAHDRSRLARVWAPAFTPEL